MKEKILTLHPDADKKGVNIDTSKYDTVKEVILGVIKAEGELTFKELFDASSAKLDELKFDGSNGWYVTSVKLDLEARSIIVHDRKTRIIRKA